MVEGETGPQPVDRDERVVIAQRRDHRHAYTEHSEKHHRHYPVKDARLKSELPARCWHDHFPVSAVETALGSLRSPSRRVNDCE